MSSATEYGVVANVRRVGGIFRHGARVAVVNSNNGWGGNRVTVHGKTGGGRNVDAWVRREHLVGFRRAHRAGLPTHAQLFTKHDADTWAMRMTLRSVGFKETP